MGVFSDFCGVSGLQSINNIFSAPPNGLQPRLKDFPIFKKTKLRKDFQNPRFSDLFNNFTSSNFFVEIRYFPKNTVNSTVSGFQVREKKCFSRPLFLRCIKFLKKNRKIPKFFPKIPSTFRESISEFERKIIWFCNNFLICLRGKMFFGKFAKIVKRISNFRIIPTFNHF